MSETTPKKAEEARAPAQDDATDAARWRALAANQVDYLVVIGRDGTYRFINHAAPGLRIEDLIGKAKPYDFIPPDQVDETRRVIESVFETGQPAKYIVRVPMLEAWFETLVVRVDPGPDPSAVLLTRDISELKRVEAEVREHQDQLDELVAKRTAQLNVANARLAKLAVTDDLTGLLNRAEVLRRLEEAVARVERYGGDLALMLVDLDHFKQVNDTYGHQAGDVVLVRAGDILRSQLREADHKGRYGGEEFLVVLPETDREGAQQMGERLRAEFAMTTTSHRGKNIQVTCSIGVACHEPGVSAEELLRRADSAMYRAKRAGRDGVESQALPAV